VESTIIKLHLPHNYILRHPMLYRFMVATHYGYIVLKMLGTNVAISIPSYFLEALVAIEKLHAIINH
jgi:hypothetical protein